MTPAISYPKARHEWKLYLFVVPSLAFILVFAYYPAFSACYHSFYLWKGGDAAQFNGLDNFRRLLRDRVLWASFGTVAVLVVANVCKLLPSIFLAVMIHRLRSTVAQYWYRVLVVVPMIVPGLVTLFIWKFFFDPNFGILNALLDLTGGKRALTWLDRSVLHWDVFRAGVPIPWLSDPHLILPSLVLWGFPWIGSVGVLIYLAGLQSIGEEVYEAAMLDGANSWHRFRHIELAAHRHPGAYQSSCCSSSARCKASGSKSCCCSATTAARVGGGWCRGCGCTGSALSRASSATPAPSG